MSFVHAIVVACYGLFIPVALVVGAFSFYRDEVGERMRRLVGISPLGITQALVVMFAAAMVTHAAEHALILAGQDGSPAHQFIVVAGAALAVAQSAAMWTVLASYAGWKS